MLRTILASLILLITAGSLSAQQTFQPQDLMKVQSVSDVVISPDGSQIAYLVNRKRPIKEGKGSNYRDLYVLNRNTGKTQNYLPGDHYIYNLQWLPDGQSLSFLGRLDDAEQTRLYTIPLGGGSYLPLTEVPHSIQDYDWNPDGSKLAYVTEPPHEGPNDDLEEYGFDMKFYEEEWTHKQLKVYDKNTGEISTLVDDASVFALDWAPQGNTIAAQIAPKNLVDHSYMFKRIYLVNAATGERELFVDNPGKLTNMSWSPNAQHLAFVAAEIVEDPVSGSLYVQSVHNPKDFEELRNYTDGFIGQVNDVAWTDANTMVYASYESTEATLRTIGLEDEESELLVEGGKMIFSSLSVADGTGALAGDTEEHPSDLYTVNLDNGSTKRHTNPNAWLDDIKMGKQETISFEARDGLRIDGVLIYPVDYEEGERYPLINLIHGGPEACMTDGWQTYYSRWGQIAAGKGYFVFMPNYRASSGRGLEFSRMDYGDLADEEFLDVIDGVNHLIDEGMVDGDKVGIGGGSYGGYFSAWAATKHSDVFRASVVFVGVSDQVSKRFTTDIPYEDYHVHWGIWTHEDWELVYDRSPVKYASNNITPTLILHGQEDPRVHPSQSLELYRALKLHGDAAVRYVQYPGEGHGNRYNPARLDYNIRTLNWFDFYLKEGHRKDEIPSKELDYGLDLD